MPPQQEMPTATSVTTRPFLSGPTGECGEGRGEGQRQSQGPQDAGVTNIFETKQVFECIFLSPNGSSACVHQERASK